MIVCSISICRDKYHGGIKISIIHYFGEGGDPSFLVQGVSRSNCRENEKMTRQK